jgi:hypothetical protein
MAPKPISEADMLHRIYQSVVNNTGHDRNGMRIYDNKALMQLLNIKDKYLKKLRDNGYIGYSREGDKYWYTQKDVDEFLKKFHYAPFATNPLLPTF